MSSHPSQSDEIVPEELKTRRRKPPSRSAQAPSASRTWKGLIWCEWFAHSKLLLAFLAFWLLSVWLLPVVANPAWLLMLGGLYALFAGPAYGGGDSIEGCEEFTFALPATRGERYLSRLLVGGGSVLAFALMDLVVLGLDLQQGIARLYLDAGFAKSPSELKPQLMYGLVVALPLAGFAFAFTLSAVTRFRLLIFTAWFWSALAAMALLHLGLWYEDLVWDQMTGLVACPLLIIAGGLSVTGGFYLYCQKEVGHYTAPITLPSRWWFWILLFLIGLAAACALLFSLARRYPRLLW